VILLHGWPGDHTDFRRVVPLLADCDVIVPDLRGFGRSAKPNVEPSQGYSAAAQARSIAALIDELGLRRPVLGGYDVGSRIAQALAKERPELVGHLVISPPLPGVGDRVRGADAQQEFWYQAFHQLSLPDQLLDGRPDAVREYLRHFWSHWSGPAFSIADADLDHLVEVYSPPGALAASIAWYRAGAGTVATSAAETPPAPEQRIAVPTSVLWPEHDPVFPREWSDRIDEFFADVRLHLADGAGHFTPVECPDEFARLIRDAVQG
jgi:pimeloyl-ACP methyl ester carboxylesterase